MDDEEILDAFNGSGSAGTQFSAGMNKYEDVEQGNFDGLLATA